MGLIRCMMRPIKNQRGRGAGMAKCVKAPIQQERDFGSFEE